MDVFPAAKRQHRLQLRPMTWRAKPIGLVNHREPRSIKCDARPPVRVESPGIAARIRPMFARSATSTERDFSTPLSVGGEAVDGGFAVSLQTLRRRAELKAVAL